eukprot:CAMPEP_0179980164 /NCGR_PEP_ID=MMETSP0983-20121128/41782_1 /TAXON_ID=483367 /ORGANISM="non described non described, Strain CCMP 2436" /LENGTH=83 /DNA_ID=CAMNT_0021898071 /DNA_START=395 /DNA_END=646 /DNA_ORIENTATION=+
MFRTPTGVPWERAGHAVRCEQQAAGAGAGLRVDGRVAKLTVERAVQLHHEGAGATRMYRQLCKLEPHREMSTRASANAATSST